MKLLSWMHRKSRDDIIEPLKKFSIGNSCSCLSLQPSLDEQQYNSESSYSSAHTKQTTREDLRYYAGFRAKEEEEVMKEQSIMMSELFHGFLSIGTLGSEPSIREPTTPKFAISSQNVKDKETEVTETALKLINDELEKFLEAEAKDVDYDSSQRSSYVSTITLSGYQNEGADADADADVDTDVEENSNMVLCPLQEYLFSSTECLERGKDMEKKKGTLEELFKNNNKIIEEHTEQRNDNEMPSKGTCATYFVKKMLKKIHKSSRSRKASGNDAADSVSSKRKLPKVLKMLNRRVYPERSISNKESNHSHKYKDKIKHQDRGVTILDKGNHSLLPKTKFKEEATRMNIYDGSLGRSHSTGKGEYWIKTDADYLVLEL